MKLFSKYKILIISCSVVFFTMCKDEKATKQDTKLLGEWDLADVKVIIDCNDSTAVSRIMANMESEMSVLKSQIFFQDSIFSVINVIDTLQVKDGGEYRVEGNDIYFIFKPVQFKFEYDIKGDSLYIIFDNLDNIRKNLKELSFSDNNLKLLYGIKDREEFELNNAHMTRVYTRKKHEND